MVHNLEAPGTDEAPEYESLYRARGDEVAAQRPIFTGDVFFDVTVEGEEQTRNVSFSSIHASSARAFS